MKCCGNQHFFQTFSEPLCLYTFKSPKVIEKIALTNLSLLSKKDDQNFWNLNLRYVVLCHSELLGFTNVYTTRISTDCFKLITLLKDLWMYQPNANVVVNNEKYDFLVVCIFIFLASRLFLIIILNA